MYHIEAIDASPLKHACGTLSRASQSIFVKTAIAFRMISSHAVKAPFFFGIRCWYAILDKEKPSEIKLILLNIIKHSYRLSMHLACLTRPALYFVAAFSSGAFNKNGGKNARPSRLSRFSNIFSMSWLAISKRYKRVIPKYFANLLLVVNGIWLHYWLHRLSRRREVAETAEKFSYWLTLLTACVV